MGGAACRARGTERRGPLALGRAGEELAARYLAGQGMRVLSRNWRCRAGELDLVATDYRGLIVCEVKTRSGDGFGAPEEAVTQEKVHRLWRLAHEWKRHHNLRCWCPLRFDVIAVSAPPGAPWTLRHFPAVGAER